MKPKLVPRAFKAHLKAVLSDENAEIIHRTLTVGPKARRAAEDGLFLSELPGVGAVGAREEAIMGRFAQFIPGIKASGRAYVTYLNKLRRDYHDYIIDQEWVGSQWYKSLSPEQQLAERQKLSHVINIFSGRGDLGALDKIGPLLSAFFYSPRYTSSRWEIPLLLFTKSPEVRKIVAGGLVRYVGTGLAMMGLAKMAGLETESDPRSADFGKIKSGPTRWNYWGSDNSIARFVTQFTKEERKSTGTGKVYSIE